MDEAVKLATDELVALLNRADMAEAKALLMTLRKGKPVGEVPRKLSAGYPEIAAIEDKWLFDSMFWAGVCIDAWLEFLRQDG